DFKYKVVRAYLDSGKTQLEICEEYGISRSSLIKWKKQLTENGQFSVTKSYCVFFYFSRQIFH
ncbi:MAG: helix-turn-helix domain-containing protein, partial [Parabacteroides sp.]|nr:helix-turn-helix domain-containing protein [Parabacteroides sp.]